MKNQTLISLLISLTALGSAKVPELPSWATRGATADSQFYYVVCSHDGLDPEDVKQIAESKCLASAAKLGGVTVKINQKTVQSLTGSDSSEVAEIQPLEKNVKCEWTDRFLEKVDQGFRVWLRCKVLKSSVHPLDQTSSTINSQNDSDAKAATIKYKRGTLTLTMIPQGDRLLVGGSNGERVIEVSSNVVTVELHEGDEYIVVRKQKYKDTRKELKDWSHGDSLNETIYLEQEL